MEVVTTGNKKKKRKSCLFLYFCFITKCKNYFQTLQTVAMAFAWVIKQPETVGLKLKIATFLTTKHWLQVSRIKLAERNCGLNMENKQQTPCFLLSIALVQHHMTIYVVFVPVLEEYHSNPGPHVPMRCLEFAIGALPATHTASSSQGCALFCSRLLWLLQKTGTCYSCGNSLSCETPLILWTILCSSGCQNALLCSPHCLDLYFYYIYSQTPFKPYLIICSIFPHPHIWNFKTALSLSNLHKKQMKVKNKAKKLSH